MSADLYNVTTNSQPTATYFHLRKASASFHFCLLKIFPKRKCDKEQCELIGVCGGIWLSVDSTAWTKRQFLSAQQNVVDEFLFQTNSVNYSCLIWAVAQSVTGVYLNVLWRTQSHKVQIICYKFMSHFLFAFGWLPLIEFCICITLCMQSLCTILKYLTKDACKDIQLWTFYLCVYHVLPVWCWLHH